MRKADCHPDRKHFAKGLCVQCYGKENYAKNHEKCDKSSKKWKAKNREKTKEYSRKWRTKNQNYYIERSAKNPKWWYKLHLKNKYNLSLEDYDRMLKDQNGVCALCRERPSKVRLAVDHDHATGRIRGLLCRVCNMYLNRVDADPSILQRIAEYISE